MNLDLLLHDFRTKNLFYVRLQIACLINYLPLHEHLIFKEKII
jgi:hypothetical protein